MLNHLTLPLLNSSSPFAICGPRPAAEQAPLLETGAWFQGAGSYQLPSLTVGTILSISLQLRTFASEGVILWITETNTTMVSVYVCLKRLILPLLLAPQPLLSLSLSQGQITMIASVLVLDQPSVNVPTLVNDGEWHSVMILINSSTASLTVDDLSSSSDVMFSPIPTTRIVTVQLGSSE